MITKIKVKGISLLNSKISFILSRFLLVCRFYSQCKYPPLSNIAMLKDREESLNCLDDILIGMFQEIANKIYF